MKLKNIYELTTKYCKSLIVNILFILKFRK